MKLQSFCLTKLVILCAVFLVFTTLAPSVYIRAKASEEEKVEEYMPAVPQGKKWKLVWSDEFNGTKVDESKWEILGDWKRRDGFWVKEDSYLDGKGNLVLRTKKDGSRYTCGAVRTKNKFEHKFGYWVARCLFPKQQGHWPAFWLHTNSVGKIRAGTVQK
ncbi:MAG: glycoside hydrolase family 16 protein [Planctomycetota bacterium]|jgi:beta-glucanase (GH16 family)